MHSIDQQGPEKCEAEGAENGPFPHIKQVLGIKNEAARMKVTPPLAVASLARGDDMRWNLNDNGIDFNS